MEADDRAIRTTERQRISRQLHESTSQLLVALQLHISQLRRSPVSSAQPLLDEMDRVVREIHESIRQVSSSQEDDDADFDVTAADIARAFYELGALERSARE